MSYGDRALKPGCRADTPYGSNGRKAELNQLKGNLRHALETFQPDEIIHSMLEILRSEYGNLHFSSIGKRYQYLSYLEGFLENQLDIARKEKNRTEEYLPEDFDSGNLESYEGELRGPYPLDGDSQ